MDTVVSVQREFMSEGVNNNCATVPAAVPAAGSSVNAGDAPAPTGTIHHVYVHIPFCARICPYCAFYKELLDRSQTNRFCQAIVREVRRHTEDRPAFASL